MKAPCNYKETDYHGYSVSSLQGEFYNIGKHQEPPFTPSVFALPPQANNMLYIGLSSFSTNSAAFVYNKAGALSLYITDDMVGFVLLTLNASVVMIFLHRSTTFIIPS